MDVGEVKTSLKEQIVKKIKPETKWSNYEQTDKKFKRFFLRVELVHVAKC